MTLQQLKHIANRYKYLFAVISSGLTLGVLTFCTYLFQEGRDSVGAFYGTCMLLSLQGQDDSPDDPIARIFISLLALVSGLIFAVYIWSFNEQHLFSKRSIRFNLIFAIMGGTLLGLATFLTYWFIEERDGVDSFYGTCMLLSLLGQDDTPETSTGMILIGILSIFSSFLFAVVAWAIIEKSIRVRADF